MREPYPLQWPEGRPRTPVGDRRISRFVARGGVRIGLASARDEVLIEMDRLGAANYVITTDLPTRRDGLPYADGRATDPGVAVWFVLDGHERVWACDRWTTHADNLHAIALSIEAIRGLERWGGADVVERAFAGFNALPPGADSGPRKRTWREVLGGTWPAELDNDELLVIAKARHRAAIRTAHPDAGGDHNAAAEINAALAEAERELGGQT